MPKVSVIIPIYKVETYIKRCATSLMSQTLDDIEFIFIDDCSPDNSLKILMETIKQYPSRLKNIRIKRMPVNHGQAFIRKQGIRLAKGDYIIHCDSDDWVDVSLYEKMYNEAVKSCADIVICPIKDEYKNNSISRPIERLPRTCNEVLENWYKKSVGMFSWNKLVKRSIYVDNDIEPFDNVNMWEDNGLMLRVFYYAKGLGQIEDACYHYNHANVNAMTNGYGRNAIDQMIRCASLLDDFFSSKSDYEKYYKTINAVKFLAKLNLVTARFDWLKEFYHLFPESNISVKWIGSDTFPKKGMIRFLFVKYHMAWLFVLLFKIKTL